MKLAVVQTTDLVGVSEYLKEVFDGTDIEYTYKRSYTGDETIEAAREADVLVLVPAYQERISKHVIESLPRCRYILGLISGYDSVDVAAATERGILVTNIPDLFFDEVADHTMALILACARKIVDLNQLVKRGEWVPDIMGSKLGQVIYPKMTRLEGQTLGLVGFGRIARGVAVRAKGFGMRVVSCDPYVDQGAFDELDVQRMTLDQLLRESDYVAILTMLTEETRGMLGLDEFRKMKPTAHVINCARGPIINRDALHTALTESLIAGAGLDVTEPEPSNPDNNPLVNLDNVIMTAHSAGQDIVAFARAAQVAAEQIFSFSRGEWPVNVINPESKTKHVEIWGQIGSRTGEA